MGDTLQVATHIVQQAAKEEWYMPVVQLVTFSIFIHAIIEVFKGVSAKGLWGIVKEVGLSLVKQTPISETTIHTLVFALALMFCKVFEYGVMTDMLRIVKEGKLVDWLDYIGTSSVVYVGVDVFYAQIQKMRGALTQTASVTTSSTTTETQSASVKP